MFKLLRYFSLTSLVSMLIASILLGVLYRQIAIQNLLQMGEDHNVDMTQTFANALWPQFSSVVAAAASAPAERLKDYPGLGALDQAVRTQARGLSVAKIKVWDIRGRCIYSSELAQIGQDGSRNAGVIAALSGKVASELVFKDRFSAFEQTIERANLISTYMPMRRPVTGETEAVFELYDDVTPFVARIERTQALVVASIVLVFSALYLALFLVVRRADRHIHSQEARLQRTQYTVDMASDLVFWVNGEGRFIYANDASVRRLGYRRQEFLGMGVWDIDPNYPRTAWPEHFEEIRRSKLLRFETRHRTKSGEEYPVEVTVSHVVFQGEEMACAFARDITERKKMEAELEDTLAEMRVILENALVGIVFIKDGRAIWVNARFKEMFGYGREEIANIRIEALYRSADAFRDIREELQPQLVQGLTCHRDAQVRHRDGRLFWCSIYGKAIDAARMEKGSIWIVQDVSERKRHEAELVRARDAAEAANRAKAEFLANVSHELLTPMNGILAMTELTLTDPRLAPEVRENLETVHGSGRKLHGLLKEILQFSELESGLSTLQASVFVLRDLLAWEIGSFQPRAEARGIRLRWEVAEDVPERLLGDTDALRQVIDRLVDNAVKFTEKGEVGVTVTKRDSGPENIVLHVAVADTGIGIEPARLDTIFEAFGQADASPARRYGGAGLGLSVSARLVRLMDGRIWAVSEPRKGSTFFIAVPLQVARQVEAAGRVA
ncbi:MAG: PAS domain S-box protein [Betaproteobacteria bacterium]|nr:PAS domain S-box protein [Betaproteobacteria bacterium]